MADKKESTSRKRAYICEEKEFVRNSKQNVAVGIITPSKIKMDYINDIREGAYYCISAISTFCVKTFLKAFLTPVETSGCATASGGGETEMDGC
jgi:hypothetical protein